MSLEQQSNPDKKSSNPDKVNPYVLWALHLSLLPMLLKQEADKQFEQFQAEFSPRLMENDNREVVFNGTDEEAELAFEMIQEHGEISRLFFTPEEEDEFQTFIANSTIESEKSESIALIYAEKLILFCKNNLKLSEHFLEIIRKKLLWIFFSGDSTVGFSNIDFCNEFIPEPETRTPLDFRFKMKKFQAAQFWKIIQDKIKAQISVDQIPMNLATCDSANEAEVTAALNEIFEFYRLLLDAYTSDFIASTEASLKTTPPPDYKEIESRRKNLKNWQISIDNLIDQLDNLDVPIPNPIDPFAMLSSFLGDSTPDKTRMYTVNRGQLLNLFVKMRECQNRIIGSVTEIYNKFLDS